MTSTTQEKLGSYATHQRNKEDSRETDARALLSCASRLRAALEAGGNDMKAYGDAVRHNQRLWTLFQIALCDAENPLPEDLKMTLLSLSRYVDKVSFRAITAFSPELLTSLIEINRKIAAGLNASRKTQAAFPSKVETTASAASVVMTTA